MNIAIDEIDVKILNYLQQNARQNHRELGDKLHKAPTTIYARIGKMEKAGLIRGYVALLDQQMINLGHNVYAHVQLKDHMPETLNAFELAMAQMPEVLECYHMAGNYDFMIRVATTDIQSYRQFLMEKLFQVSFVHKVDSAVVMKEAKKVTSFDLKLGHAHKSPLTI